ncbi:MAG TPA: tRNA glutamyl-Q(34) synthetase GluQRS [Polyangiaceae bacterium]
MTVRTRFAPSPTGDLHLGGAWTALASWAVARRAPAGRSVLRVEDLDPPRVVAGSEARILDDLAWLGLDWDETAPRQSTRAGAYEAALDRLAADGLVYPCDCSRAEIARAASAPHAGEETVYPGTCRDADAAREMKRAPAWRVRVPDVTIAYDDGAVGCVEQELARAVGDFVVRRADGVFAYQLAVVVDDADQGITDVVRGADLVASTPRQIWLAQALGLPVPRFTHVALVVASDGQRLEKRTRGTTLRELRAAGFSPESILGELAFGLGLTPSPIPATAASIAAALRPTPIPWRTPPWPIPPSLAASP